MLTHSAIWAAIDSLAEKHELTPSGLARKAGLDPTTFNRSKRVSLDGKQRWPSTESLSKVIDATGATIGEFLSLVAESSGARAAPRIPTLAYADILKAGHLDEAGHPAGPAWEKVPFPQIDDPQTYAIDVTGDALMPLYKEGVRLVVSPNAAIRRGDRVLVKALSGDLVCMEFRRRTLTRIELQPFDPEKPEHHIDSHDIAWIARIIWASQ